MTGNSRRKKEYTDKFLGSIFIQRGRIYWQKTQGELNKEIYDALNER